MLELLVPCFDTKTDREILVNFLCYRPIDSGTTLICKPLNPYTRFYFKYSSFKGAAHRLIAKVGREVFEKNKWKRVHVEFEDSTFTFYFLDRWYHKDFPNEFDI